LILNGFVCRDYGTIQAAGLSFGFLLEMQDLGLLSGVDATGLEFTMQSVDGQRFVRLLLGYNAALMVTHSDASRELKLPVYKVMPLGQEVLSLGLPEPNTPYLTGRRRNLSARIRGISRALLSDCKEPSQVLRRKTDLS